MPDRPELRVSDDDREATVARLRVAGGEGRLTLEELAERVELADAARTRGDLDALTADLPRAAAGEGERKDRGWIVAIMGGAERRGRWRPARSTIVVTVMGGAELDLREAELADGVRITAITIMGGIGIAVPDGVSVEMGGFAFMGTNGGPRDRVPPLRSAPTVSVRAFSLMGGVGVERKRSRHARHA
ncbi:MAG TPA: DUF1707 domain-containing protein [Solirubrobacteraceae bacterium]|jgi:hypothetical protein|nr:DUF1707 domain-containing protein [Solirubrobacteraceae bacterium]